MQGRDEIIAFSFAEGGIVGADALNQSLEEGLGGVLASQHLVDPSEFASLAAEHESGGGRVVDLLVERSFLSRGQLLESLRMHTYRLCLEALSWANGEYRFYQGDEVAYESGVEPIGVSELLVRSSLELGGVGPLKLPIPELDGIYGRSAEVLDKPDNDATGENSLGGSHRALALLDGERTLREVAASCDLPTLDIRDLASEWIEAGIIEKLGERQSEGAYQEADFDPILSAPLPEIELGSAVQLSPAELGGASFEPVQPPSPVERSSVERQEPRPDSRWPGLVDEATGWLNRVFGLGILAATFFLLMTGPVHILSPFPWQGTVIESLRAQQRAIARLNIQRGAETFFILMGRYPESLDELESRDLVKSADLEVRSGGRWRLTTSPTSFVLQSPGLEESDEGGWTSSIVGNFLLDPEFVRPTSTTDGPLLVLLD